MERIASGYSLAEAPVAASDGGVFFSDVLGGGVYRWSPGSGEVETVIASKRGVGGMALHGDGGLVMGGRDVSHVVDGETRVLFADEAIAGLNDLTVDPDGDVVVGVLHFRPFADETPVPGEFVRIGDRATVAGDVLWANGCAYSPDGATFYGCDYHRGVVFAADRHDDGTHGPPRALIETPGGEADGMAVDEHGALWVALGARGSVGRFRPDGALDSEVQVPAGFVASLCFGGDDLRDLFVTTLGDPKSDEDPGAVFLTRAPVAGSPVPLARSI